jgi:hypothetical protein
MKTVRRWALGMIGAVLLAGVGRAQGVYHNQRVFVVPAPGKVAVDGDLGDWDLSGEILTYVVEASMAYQSAKTAFMYDDQALYISSRVADPTPLLNKADPAVNPDFGWDGDAFQFRLCLDPALGYPLKIGGYDRTPNENLVHMTLWYYTDAKKPVLHLKYGMNYHDAHGYHKGVVPADKFEGVYVPWPDGPSTGSGQGKGFTFEYRIPWATLGAPRPLKAGDLAAAAIQIQWSDATGLHSYGGGWAVDLMAHAGFTYQSTGPWGKAIFAEKGNLPKELTQEGVPPVRKMPLKMTYELPKELIASISLFNAKGDLVRNIVAAESRPAGKVIESWDGLDSAGRVLPAGDYTWKGLHHEPLKTKYILGLSNSGSPSYNTPDGKGAWGGDWANPVDICFAGEKGSILWAGSEAGTGLIGINADGQKQWGYRIGGEQLATDGEWVYVYLGLEKQIRAYGLADGKQLNFLRGELWAEHNAVSNTTACTGLAWLGGKLYAANEAASEVTVYEARQGKILSRFAVPAPRWLAACGTDLLAVSAGKIVRVSGLDSKPLVAPFAEGHLDNPQAVAVGPDGAVHVSNQGKLHNVSVFAKDGTFLRSIGKAGGRAMAGPVQPEGNVSPSRAGKWDPDTLLNPRGLAVDAKGRLWVTENDFSPKRVSVWDPATGKLLDEKFGPCFVSTPVCMDPKDPTRVYCQNVEWAVDLDKGTWKPAAVMFEAKPDAPYFWPHMVNNIVFTAKNGKQYMHHSSYQGSAVAGKFLWVRRGDHFEAVAGVIGAYTRLTWRAAAKDWQEAQKIPTLFWEDLNADGVIQENETRPTKLRPGNMHSTVDADLNFYATGMYNDLYWERVSPREIRKDGVPLYDEASLLHVDYAKDHSLYTYDLTVNPADGSVLAYMGADIKHLDRTEIWPLNYWSRDGRLLWRYRMGCRWHDMYEFPIPKAGVLYGCTKNLGITDGLTGYSCYFGQCQLLTTDGVPIGTLMKDGRSGEVGPETIQCEWFTGQLVRLDDDPSTGSGQGRWFLLGGDQDGRVLQVFGLDTIRRFAGKLTIGPEEVQAAGEALAEWSAQKAKSQTLVLARCPDKPAWPDIRAVKVDVDANRSFTARVAYDAANLLVRYEVRSPFELVNSTQEPQLVFKGGNCLDVQLATDPNADPKRDKPAPGDLRLLITRRDGKPLAVVYRPKIAGFAGEPTVFKSPTGQESFDGIEVWQDVQLDYEKVEGGFNATVTLPLVKLGLVPKPGTVQRMDVGYIFGNDTGNITATRAYWSNQSFSSKVTQDVPNESRLEPAQWGNAAVE